MVSRGPHIFMGLLLTFAFIFMFHGNCYADTNRYWSLQDLKNIIYKAKMNRNSNWQSAYVSELDGQDNNLQAVVNEMNNYSYVYFVVRDSWNTYDIGLTNEPQHWYLYRNCPISKNTVTSGTNIGYSITYDSGNFTYLKNDMADHTSYDHKSAYNYYGMDIENQNNNTIIYNAGYYLPNDFFNEWVWLNSNFYISNNVNSSTEYISLTTVDGTRNNIPVLYSDDFGTLIDDDYMNYQNDNLDIYYFVNGSWVKKRLFIRVDPGLLYSNSYMTFSWNQNYNRCELSLKELYSFKNVLYHYDLLNAANNQAFTYFYMGDSNTSISNGTIDTSQFPSDYLSQFSNLDLLINDNDNTESIIESINDIVGDIGSGDQPGTGLLGSIKRLFVPEPGFFGSYFNDLDTWFSNHLGLLYFPFSFIVDFLTRVINIDFSDPAMVLGPYTMPLFDDFEIVPEIEIYFNDFLVDERMQEIHNYYLIIVDGLLIFGFIRLLLNKYNEIVGGKSS